MLFNLNYLDKTYKYPNIEYQDIIKARIQKSKVKEII